MSSNEKMACPRPCAPKVVYMQSIAEIRNAGKEAFVKSVLEIGEKTQDQPFNTDMSFAEQIASFDQSKASSQDFALMIEDAKKFR